MSNEDNFGQINRHLVINRELKYDVKTAIPIGDVVVKMEPNNDPVVHKMGLLYTVNHCSVDICNWATICRLHGEIKDGPQVTRAVYTFPAPKPTKAKNVFSCDLFGFFKQDFEKECLKIQGYFE